MTTKEDKKILEAEEIEVPDFLDGIKVCSILDPECEACQ